MIPFFISFFSWDWLVKNLGFSEAENLNNDMMVNSINDDVFEALKAFIKVYEGYEDKAYNLGDGKITIGYGTTQWLTPSGNVLRSVRLGDTITEVVADQQLRYYFIKIIPKINQYLGQNNMRVPVGFLASLLNFSYMSGSGLFDWPETKRMFAFANNNIILSSVSLNVKSEIVGKYKRFVTNETEKRKYGRDKIFKWQIYGLGWSRRIQASVDAIEGKMKKKSWYDTNIKKPF